jgi:hypothetical protein
MLTTIKFSDGTTPKIYSHIFSTVEKHFKIISRNRGVKEGYDQKRVNKIMNLFITNKFVWEFGFLIVTYRKGKLVLLDGANRLTAIRQLISQDELPKDYEIPFVVIDDNKFASMSESDLIEFMADMNDYDPRWNETEHFNAAYNAGLKTALKVQEYVSRSKNPINDEKLSYQIIKPTKISNHKVKIVQGHLLAIAKQVPYNEVRTRFNDYRDNDIASIMNTERFEHDYNSFIEFIEIAKEWQIMNNVRVSKSIRYLTNISYGSELQPKMSYIVKKLKGTRKMPKTDKDIKTFLKDLILP